jgi:diguanylate cyclase (GGDEF)-like protein
MSSDLAASPGALVLVVELESSESWLLQRLLERAGYRVVTAADFGEIVRMSLDRRPDIVVLDIGRSDPEGWETLDRIRAVSSVPVVILSGVAQAAQVVRGLAAGADDFLTRPIREDEFLARVGAVLRRSDEARHDALTGLPNRRAFDEHLGGCIARSREDHESIALVLLDIDGFKKINDLDGHAVGDRVLRDVARTALRQVRISEEIFRVGGDEFAIVLRGDHEAARKVAERVRVAAVAQRRAAALPTLSAGIAVCPTDATGKDELFESADRALYAAKEAGRNTIVVYGDELARLSPPSA